MKSSLPEDTEFARYTCPGCGWSPILPKVPTLWCLFCGEGTFMIASDATREEYENQAPSIVIARPEP